MESTPSRTTSPFLASAMDVTKDCVQYFGNKILILVFLLVFVAILEIIGIGLLLPILTKLGFTSGSGADNSLFYMSFFDASQIDLNTLLVLTLIIFTFRIFIQYGIDAFTAGISSQYAAYWRQDLFKNFTNANMAFFNQEKSATLISAIVRETDRVRLSMDQLAQIVKTTTLCVAYIFVALVTSWETCVLLAIFGILSFTIIRPLSKRADAIGKHTYQSFETMQKYAVEFLQAAKLLKVTASEKSAQKDMNETIQKVQKLSKQEIMHPYIVQSFFEFFGIATLIGVIYVAVSIFEVSGPRMIIALFLFTRVYSRLSSIEKYRQSFRIYVTSFYELKKLKEKAIAHTETIYNKGHTKLPSPEKISIQAKDVGLSYGSKKVLNDINLTINSGQIIGIAGGSGAGKTSLVDSLLGLAHIQGGDIFINDIKLEELDIHDFRQHVGYITQNTVLFHDTIQKNITWGSANFSQKDVERAAKMAQAHDFISKLPNGYDTIIGDDGQTLSGGQRQRLGLARALLGQKSLLILDETTSALDARTEHEITKVIGELRGKITIIIITHRLSSLQITDKIYFLDDGRIIEEGGFDELTKGATQFQALNDIQKKTP